jgi:hypothetical protein
VRGGSRSAPPRSYIVSGHLHDVGAPIKLLHIVFEKIWASESVAISFYVAPGGITCNQGITPAEFPSGVLGAKALTLETNSKSVCVKCIERGYAIDDDQTMDIELQLH